MNCDIVIIGAGIWGLSTAYHLLQSDANLRVLLIERQKHCAAETTSQSAGQVGQLRRDALLSRAIGYTIQLFSQLQDEAAVKPGWVRSGSLHVALTRERLADFQVLHKLAKGHGTPCEFLNAEALAHLAPGVNSQSVFASLHVPNDGYVDALAATRSLEAQALARGCQFLYGAPAEELLVGQDKVLGVRTSSTTVHANSVVLCCGPWASQLLKPWGFAPPIYPIRLQQGRTIRCGVRPAHPVLRAPDLSCYLRPEMGGYLYGCFYEDPMAIDLQGRGGGFRTRDLPADEALMAEFQTRMSELLPRLRDLPIEQYRQGMITCTPDGLFALGPVPDVQGLYMGSGCGGTGIAASGAIGKWLAEWAMNGKTAEDLSPYRPGRFGERCLDSAWLEQSAKKTAKNYYRLAPASTLRATAEE